MDEATPRLRTLRQGSLARRAELVVLARRASGRLGPAGVDQPRGLEAAEKRVDRTGGCVEAGPRGERRDDLAPIALVRPEQPQDRQLQYALAQLRHSVRRHRFSLGSPSTRLYRLLDADNDLLIQRGRLPDLPGPV